MLDRLTLQAQLVSFSRNGASLDASIAEKTQAYQQAKQMMDTLAVEITSLQGARKYHDLIIQQTQQAIAEVDKATQAAQ